MNEELDRLIKESGLTAREIARRAGISEQHLCGVRSGKRPLTRALDALIKGVIKDEHEKTRSDA